MNYKVFRHKGDYMNWEEYWNQKEPIRLESFSVIVPEGNYRFSKSNNVYCFGLATHIIGTCLVYYPNGKSALYRVKIGGGLIADSGYSVFKIKL